MEPYTLDRSFHKKDVIDGFHSIIWTERYYGDSDVELVVPITSDMIEKLPLGIFLGLPESDEIMILETMSIENEKLKLTGISLLPWFNNRFVRTSAIHKDEFWSLPAGKPGWVVWAILWNMCHKDSPYLNGTLPMGIANPQQLAILGLDLKDYDKTGDDITVGIPFEPVYNAMRKIAVTHEIGMQITLESVTDTSYSLEFRSYRGLDRTSGQSLNPAVRFSPQFDSLTNIKELQSIAILKTLVYAFAPGITTPLPTTPGESRLTGEQYTGFDLRAEMITTSDITTDMVGGDAAKLLEILNSRADAALKTNHFIKTVDGEIVPTSQFKYGVHYNLGDIIEVQGNSEIVQTSRVIEYIRAHDEAGERAYPTVAMLG